ncbi:MAG TPA: DUF1134 domain-containing protein [Hyphomicrobiaceae bacterium]|nr:DUF1134 domain-containing protein [Hyphomicrobiaceae bacterium]
MRRLILTALVAAALLGGGRALATAQSCAKEDFAQAVDRAGAQLRKLNAEQIPQVQAKIRKLKEAKGWQDEKAYETLQDERMASFDAQANDLLAKIDTLGTVDPAAGLQCGRLDELTAASLELQATVKAKATYTLSKVDQILGDTPAAETKPKTDPKKKLAEPKKPATSELQEPEQIAQLPLAKPATPKVPETSTWSTHTQEHVARNNAVVEPSSTDQYVPPLTPDEEGYSIQEIMAASEGFFGKVSANLGAVIEYLFRKSGRPTAYVLGSEGGGAFLAGVRYGKGTLYLRSGTTQKIYWHGPTLGTDVGAEGSKTLFLIYKLHTPDELYANFTGIDGSAYLVGGVGATLVGNGKVIMAPIRSGIGLRLGANIGYIRFTANQTWNPF